MSLSFASLQMDRILNNPHLLSIYEKVRGQTLVPWPVALPITGLFLYAIACRSLRYRRRNAIHKKYYYPTRESLSKMTNDEAQAIGEFVGQLEFPYIYVTSLQFALFKTYAIPTISKILIDTKQLTTPQNASKRYADTVVILDEIVGNPPTSTRCLKSLARLNYLHGQYPQILNSDFLYTLAQFILCPIEFINSYEWRELSQMEICAISTLWKAIGDDMNIDYAELKRSKQGWKDGIEFYDDLKEWAESYEEKFMVPAETNRQTGDETVALLLCLLPGFLHPYARNFLSILMGDRVRTAMMYPPASAPYYPILSTILNLRRLTLRYLSPPRPTFLASSALAKNPNPLTNRYNYAYYQAHPYYVAPTFFNRWVSPQAWIMRIMGGAVPGSNNEEYDAEGYLIEEVGPKRARGKGLDKMEVLEKKLRSERVAGCPFVVKGV